MKAPLAFLAAALIASWTPALAHDGHVDSDRKALLVSIIENLGCSLDGTDPGERFLAQMKKNAFQQPETRAIAQSTRLKAK